MKYVAVVISPSSVFICYWPQTYWSDDLDLSGLPRYGKSNSHVIDHVM